MAHVVIFWPVMFHITQAKLFLINVQAKERPKESQRYTRGRSKVGTINVNRRVNEG